MKPLGSTWSIRGRTAVVTGASSGIGLATATAIALVKADEHVTIVRRNAERHASAAETAGAASQYPVASYRTDFTNLASVWDLADKLRAAHEEIDPLVNNAGPVARKQTRSADGYEQTLYSTTGPASC